MSCISLVPDSTPFWDGRPDVRRRTGRPDASRRDAYAYATRSKRNSPAQLERSSSGYKMRRGYVEKGVAMIWYMKWGNFQKIVS